MNLRIPLIFIFILTVSFLFAGNLPLNPEQYIVKPNDLFLLQSVSIDTVSVRTPVSPTGFLNLYPFADTVFVAGKTLKEANILIDKKLSKSMKQKNVIYSFIKVAPVSFTVIGAVVNPGEYNSELTPSLYEGLKMAGGLISSSSNKIKIINNGKEQEYNINKYLFDGDVTHNPLINNGDIIKTSYAKENLKVFTNNDTLNFVQSIELEDSKPISDIINSLSSKHNLSSFENFTVIQDGKTQIVNKDFKVKNGDKLIIPIEEIYVYVTGSVSKPGKVAYNGAVNPQYYIAQAGGSLPAGSRHTIYIITKDGKKYKYKNQKINSGDILYVPDSLRTQITAYLIPIGTVVSLISTVIIINNSK